MKKLLRLGYPHSKPLLLLLFLFQAALVWLALTSSQPLIPLVLLLLVFLFPVIIYSPQYIFLVLLVYISILPNMSWGAEYDLFQFYVSRSVVYFLLILSFAIFIIRNGFEKKWTMQLTVLDVFIGVFLVYATVNLLWGLYLNTSQYETLTDYFPISLYVTYFLVRFLFVSEKWIKRFLIVFVFASTFAALEYIVLALTNLDLTSIFINRVTTQQPHLAQISVPLLVGVLLYLDNTRLKIGAILFLGINLLMVIFSQQRGLWVGIVFSLFALLLLYHLKDGFSFGRIARFLFGFLLVITLLVAILILLERYLNLTFILTAYQRVVSMLELAQDRSLQIRMAEIGRVLGEWKEHMLVGEGLGATYERIYVFRGNSGVDNSYIFVLWKLGIIGLLLFMGIYITYIGQNFRLYWKLKTTREQFVLASLGVGMAGMLVIALTNQSIILYRFNLIWAAILGISQNMSQRYLSIPDS